MSKGITLGDDIRAARTDRYIKGPTGKTIRHDRHQELIGFWVLWTTMGDGRDGMMMRGRAKSTVYRLEREFREFFGFDVGDGLAPLRPSEWEAFRGATQLVSGGVPERGSRALR